MTNNFGSFQLTSSAGLPNVAVAYAGEHWSDGKAAVAITPGQLVVPAAQPSGVPPFGAVTARRLWTVASAGALDPRACIALRPVDVPDLNPGSEYNPQLTPNQIKNLVMPVGAWVHTYRSGRFHLTLIAADTTYREGDLLTFDPAATAQTGKPAGVGAWVKTSTPANALLEITRWAPFTSDNTQGVITAQTIRVQD